MVSKRITPQYPNVLVYYLFLIFTNMNFSLPIFVIFCQTNSLNFTQIALLQSTLSFFIFVFEVPTGAIGDIFGRKKCLILGSAFLVFSYCLYAFGRSFYTFLIAEAAGGIGMTFYSGSTTALVYDSLKHFGKEKDYKKITSRGISYALIAASLSFLIASYVSQENIRVPFYLTVASYFGAFVTAFLFKEFRKEDIHASFYKILGEIKESTAFVFSQSKVRLLFFYNWLLAVFLLASFWFYQPYLQEIKIPLAFFGAIYMAFMLFSSLTSRFAYHFEEKLGKKSFLLMLGVSLILSFFLMSIVSHFGARVGLLLIFVQEGIRGASMPMFSYYINEIIPSDKRATILSINSMFSRLFYMCIIPLFGYWADRYMIEGMFFIGGVALLVLFVFLIALSAYNANT